MTKALKASPEQPAAKDSSVAAKLVRNPETGQVLTVRGFGALEGSSLKLKKNVSLLKPIAEQALVRPHRKRKTD